MASSKKDLGVTLTDLNIGRNELVKGVDVPKTVFDNYVFYSQSGSSVKCADFKWKKKRFSSFIKRIKTKFPSFKNESAFNKRDKQLNTIGMYCPINLTYEMFFRYVRNAIAHANVVEKGKCTYFFQLVSYNKTDDIKTILNKKLRFLLILKSIYDLDVLFGLYGGLVGIKKLKVRKKG